MFSVISMEKCQCKITTYLNTTFFSNNPVNSQTLHFLIKNKCKKLCEVLLLIDFGPNLDISVQNIGIPHIVIQI